jgi:hypothetical protein
MLMAMVNVPAGQAATGTTAVDITFPPLVILYYFNNIDVTMDAADLETLVLNGNATELAGCNSSTGTGANLECASTTDPKTITGAGTITGTSISYSAAVEADAPASSDLGSTAITVVLENAWAVRALATSLNATIAVSGTGDFSSPVITPANPTPALTLTDGSNIGDVEFDVDLNAITGFTASDTLTITVVSP